MGLKDKVIKEFPLTEKINCNLECYKVAKRRYIIFWDALIKAQEIPAFLDFLEEETISILSDMRTLIVVGQTEEEFKKNDLVFFNGVNIFVVFYLQNKETKQIYFNDSRNIPIGTGWRKIVKQINSILHVQTN